MKRVLIFLMSMLMLLVIACSDDEADATLLTKVRFVNDDYLAQVEDIYYCLGEGQEYRPLFRPDNVIPYADSLVTVIKAKEFQTIRIRYSLNTNSGFAKEYEFGIPLHLQNGVLRLNTRINNEIQEQIQHYFTYAYWSECWDGDKR